MAKQAAHFKPLRDKLADAIRRWGAAAEEAHYAEIQVRDLAAIARDIPTWQNGEALASAIAHRRSKERLLTTAQEEYQAIVEDCLPRWREV
jgi:hypothetical protein